MASNARTKAQGDFAGDHAIDVPAASPGLARRWRPASTSASPFDQSRSAIDVPLAFQSATLDLTQFRAELLDRQGAVDRGLCASSMALARSASKRDTGRGGFAYSNYNATVDGVLGEIDYYWMQNQSRIVPKLAFSDVRLPSDGFTEKKGDFFFLVTATGATCRAGAGFDRRRSRPLLDLRSQDPRPVGLRKIH